ncbi:dihydrodipicolinate synthase family protein [Aspergillus clavatus NRRL 1]|uniref:Dihydrodipicolinate synthase n=1 Tax=Aspergillus clavatus (strain ATCC 1007 / CBS 513.65 / DSM 816 / NCTC 3887 / NRRL 1 / QM 1276 / 107) TaxID=344612 RepID=A1C790_ASPCL|nr:dihydrodipicolinate synthase [Aspergillus clavatus NRRL 1]EAW14261.1 dihydrodipicolinate synthase [Aspergillus clavatus NRRL 1]
MSTHLDIPARMAELGQTDTTTTTTTSTPSTIYSHCHRNPTYSSTTLAPSEEHPRRILKPGLYVPTLASFSPETEEVDESTTAQHAVRMAKAGVMGLITHGTYGEAAHLSHTERCRITRTTRHAVAAAGYPQMPIIVGCGAPSTSETIELCQDARDSGGDYALLLFPSAYMSHYTKASLRRFFEDVAGASPLPVLIYNYPAVTGVDLDAETIAALAQHPNIVGCKLTCNNMGKLNQIVATVKPATFSDRGSEFMCFGGSADAALQAMIGGGSGVIAGLGNVMPKACVKLVELYHLGRIDEARQLQGTVAKADQVAIEGGVSAVKSALRVFYGYGGYARRPLRSDEKEKEKSATDGLKEGIDLEKSL